MSEFINALVSGVAQGVPLFVAASGLTLIYGVMGILNFAHGAFFLLGAYVMVTTLGGAQVSLMAFVGAGVVVAVAVAAVGVVSERVVFRPLHRQGHTINLLASFALLLILDGALALVYGTTGRTQEQATELRGTVQLGSVTFVRGDVFFLCVGALVAVGLWALLRHTAFGRKAAAVAQDRAMAQVLGIRVPAVVAGIFALGAGLAGLAGALAAPLYSIAPGLDESLVLQSFAVVIVGGLGSVGGSLGAALLIGVVNSLLVSYVPVLDGYGIYIATAGTLLLRPQGLFARDAEVLA